MPGRPDATLRAAVLESLLQALGETSQFERAFRLAGSIDEMAAEGLGRARRAALHARLAGVADIAGRWVEGQAQVEAARALLGPEPADEDVAPVDAIAASLALSGPNPDRLATATTLARRAAVAAGRAKLPVVECEAWQLLGLIAREHDLTEADTYFERSLRLAERHHLPFKRIYALAIRAGTACLVDGDLTGLTRTRQEALRVGALAVAYGVDGILALQAVLRGEFAAASRMIDECWQVVVRLRFVQTAQYMVMTRATLAAHQGRRREMEEALAEFGNWGGPESAEMPLAFGLARTFCALLEEDRELAGHELAQALSYEAENPTAFHLAGKNGLRLLLGVLDGRMDWPQYQEITQAPASRMPGGPGRSTRWPRTWGCGWWPRPRTTPAGVRRPSGCAARRTTFTGRGCWPWPVPAARPCGGWGLRSRSAGTARTRCRPC